MKNLSSHHTVPQIAGRYGQMGIFQLAHNGPILIFYQFDIQNPNLKGVNFMKNIAIISIWGPILQAILKVC